MPAAAAVSSSHGAAAPDHHGGSSASELSSEPLIDSSAPTRRRDVPSPSASPPLPGGAAAAAAAAAAGAGSVPPLLLPRPPESARPSTSAAAKPASHSQQHGAAATARPNTAAGGSSAGGAPKPHPPPGAKPAPINSASNAAAGSSSGAVAAPAASPGGTGAPAVSHYSVGKTLGEGTFGKVKKGIHKLTGLTVAIKILEKERIVDLADVERVKREIHILTRVRHPNVIRLFEVIDSARHIFLIMEYVPGGELFDYIVAQGRVQDEQACRIFHHILNGVDYFHNKNIIHRDLKPENLLLDAETGIKIVDFGLGNVVKGGKLLKTACGSPCYAAPEMIGGKKYVGPGVDCWSLGVILFALLAGYLPFEDANTARLYEKIMGGEYEVPDCVTPDGKDLISRLLNTDPRKRYNAEQVRRHPWYARMHTSTDPVYPGEDPSQIPVVPGPQASGRRVKHTRGGHAIDDEDSLDAAVLSQMVALGYSAQAVAESVERRRHDHLAATYHLLQIKKQMDLKAAGKATPAAATGAQQAKQQASNSGASNGVPSSGRGANASAAPVPRIPTGSGAPAAPMVPSAPVAVHHHAHAPVPPSAQKPAYLPAQRGATAAGANAAFMQTQPLPSSSPTAAASGHPVPSVPASSARVQSAGAVRPSAPVPPPASARPTTSYVHKPHTHPHPPSATAHHHHAWGSASSSEHAQGSPMPSPPASASPSPPPPAGSPLGVANGINGGSGVNAYMQHFQAQQQQQAALYGQQQQQQSAQASAYGYSSARPPSGSPIRSHLPKSAGSARGAGTIATPKYARAVSRGGRAAAQQQQLAATMPYGGSTTYRAAADASATLGVSGGMLAVGPATGRPMTSRITGSTGGVSHRLYLPPQEKAAQELATAAAMAAAAASAAANLSRPSSGTGTRPSSGYHMSRPGTSHHNRGGGAARPPSAAAGLVGLGLGAGGLGVGMGWWRTGRLRWPWRFEQQHRNRWFYLLPSAISHVVQARPCYPGRAAARTGHQRPPVHAAASLAVSECQWRQSGIRRGQQRASHFCPALAG